jgi:Cys-rich repeat protein
MNHSSRRIWHRALLSIALVVPILSGCSSSDNAASNNLALNGGIGAICSDSSGCAKGETCRSDTSEWISHHQCTATCASDADCTSAYGNHTMCIGAHVCVSKCLDDSNCPSGTICNENGWCGNTGPASGVPICSGTPEPCSAILDETSCFSAIGCSWNGYCYGAQSETSCKKISASLCKYTPGCTLVPQ